MSKTVNKTDGLITTLSLKSPKYKVIYWSNIVLLSLICVITIFPALWIFLSAFKDAKEFISVPPTIIPHSFEPHKIVEVWTLINFGKYFTNSIAIIIGCWFSAIVFNGMAGYVFSKIKPAGSSFVQKVIFFTMLMPTSMNMIPLYSEFVDFPILGINLTNTYFPVWMMSAISCFDILLFRSFFNGISDSIVEAAKIDGSTEIGIFAKIIVPMSKPILTVISIFSINGSWGSFFWPYITIKDAKLYPVSVMLYNMQSQLSADKYMVVMMFAALPPLIIFAFLSRQIIGGINLGGVKG